MQHRVPARKKCQGCESGILFFVDLIDLTVLMRLNLYRWRKYVRFMHERQFCIVLFAVVLYERAGTAAIGEGCGKTSDQRRGGARVTALKPEKETSQ